ncbi:MAG: beta-lactamase family protein [Planctomycetes bacterium]|nr:beta-lactamase family protein [Planctomycetota bacterium]
MTPAPAMEGACDPRFEAVREAFAHNFAARGDVGAAVCVYVAGKPVVDLWGGFADRARARRWERDTMACVASTTKGMTALCALMLAERGLLDLDAPVARYWPEFGQAGKERIPVRWLLSHRAGLPAPRRAMAPESLFDWAAFTGALAAAEPWWEPGTTHGYHATTFGFLVGEVARRVAGESVGRFFRREVAARLSADFFIGVPEGEDGRAAEILPEPPAPRGEPTLWDLLLADRESLSARAFLNPPRSPGEMNSRAWRAAEIPGSNGHATARALARVYAALAAGGVLDTVRLLAPETIAAALVEQSYGPDAVLLIPTRFGSGFMLTMPESAVAAQTFGPNPRSFGHPGRGGSIGFADPDANLGFGYVMNQYLAGTARHPDLRWVALAKAAYAALGVTWEPAPAAGDAAAGRRG